MIITSLISYLQKMESNIKMELRILTSTTRENRQGIKVANWIFEKAQSDSNFNTQLLDLKEINLPLMDEPNHPSLGKYEHEHTKAWSKKINEADAFIFVLAEYNYGFPAPIKNAIDYLHREWKYKPVAFVSYGGISAGLRSTQMMKQVVTTLNMMPIATQVNIPFFATHIQDGRFVSNEQMEISANKMLEELYKWTIVMKQMR